MATPKSDVNPNVTQPYDTVVRKAIRGRIIDVQTFKFAKEGASNHMLSTEDMLGLKFITVEEDIHGTSVDCSSTPEKCNEYDFIHPGYTFTGSPIQTVAANNGGTLVGPIKGMGFEAFEGNINAI